MQAEAIHGGLKTVQQAFLYNHAAEVWACDFLLITDLLFCLLLTLSTLEYQECLANRRTRRRGRAHIAGERRVPGDLIKQWHTFHRKPGDYLSRPFATGPLKAARSFPDISPEHDMQ